MAAITKLKSGNFRARIRKNGRCISQTFEKMSYARQWANKYQTNISEGKIGLEKIKTESITLSQSIDRFISDYPALHQGKMPNIGNYKIVKQKIGAIKLNQLLAEDINKFRDYRLGKGIKPSTINKELFLIGAAIKYSIKRGLFNGNVPLVDKLKVRDARNRRLTKHEEALLLQYCIDHNHPQMYYIIILALETAMRLSEIVTMKWENVNFEKKSCFLPKTKNGETRTIPLSPNAYKALLEMHQTPDNIAPEGRIFDYWTASTSVTHSWKRMVDRLGIQDLRFHDLRHEATSRLFEKGLDPIKVSMITGHKTLTMLNRYTHLYTSDVVNILWKDAEV